MFSNRSPIARAIFQSKIEKEILDNSPLRGVASGSAYSRRSRSNSKFTNWVGPDASVKEAIPKHTELDEKLAHQYIFQNFGYDINELPALSFIKQASPTAAPTSAEGHKIGSDFEDLE